MSRRTLAMFVGVFTLAVTSSALEAAFHLMQVEQVIGGVNGDTTAQAIQLRMRSAGQNLISGTRLRVFDASGLNPVTIITFPSNVPNGASGARILIASPAFSSATSPAAVPNFTMTNLIPASYLAAGSLVFESGATVYWRLSWGGGSYTGSTTGSVTNDSDGNFGPPFAGACPSGTLQALQFTGPHTALSTTNAANYAITAGAAVFTNNAGTSFTVIAPAPTGACCDDSTGNCTNGVTEATCDASAFRYGGDGSSCGSIDPPCTGPTGACCDDDTGMCSEAQTESTCLGAGNRYGGVDSTCGDIDPPCTGPLGACCNEVLGTCEEGVSAAQCDADGGRFGGNGSTCANIDPPCEAVQIRVVLEPVATGLVAPIHVTHAGDGSGRLFVVEQSGVIRVIADGLRLGTPFLDVTAKLPTLGEFFDERGLLGLAFHPDYETNGKFYVHYSAPRTSTGSEPCDLSGFNPGCHKEVLAEYTVLGDPATSNVADPSSERILFEVDEPQFNHNGGMVEFGPDGYLYFSLGDGGGANDGLADGDPPGSAPTHGPIGNGQDIETALGKVLRIDVDSAPAMGLEYAIPPDNPFVGVAGLDEIYAFGFRNPFRFSFDDPAFGGTGELYLADVGQNLYEEVNIVELGGNYGWVIREGFDCFDPFDPGTPPPSCPTTGAGGEPLLDPVSVYSHVDGGLAILGGYVYRGSGVPAMAGKYIYGDFSADFGPTGRLYYFDLTGAGAYVRQEFLTHPDDQPIGQFLKGLGIDQDGEIYVCASDDLAPSGSSGVVYRITAPPAAPAAEFDPVGRVRYLAVRVPSELGGQDTAIRVELTSLHHPLNPPAGSPDFSAFEGEYRYVRAFVDGGNNPVFACGDTAPHDAYTCATLGCEPEYRDWAAILGGEDLHLTADTIVPSSDYSAVVLAASCLGIEESCAAASDEIALITERWGDVAAGGGSPPDGSTNVIDIGTIVDKVKGTAASLAEARCWLKQPSSSPVTTPINVIDVGHAIDAVKGLPYPANFTITSCP